MKKRVAIAVASIMLISSAVTFAAQKAPLSTSEIKKNIAAGKPTVVFFQNPYGGPCRAQKRELDKLNEKMKGKFNIAAVNAMDQNDQKAFYDYGVRSLPSLVLVDKSGNINKVFPPGIQSADTIAAAINSIK